MATSKYYHNIDLTQNELINVKLHPLNNTERMALASTLGVEDKGLMVFDITDNSLYGWNGYAWTKAVNSTETYVHIEPIPTATWVITHNLNKFPSVTVVDSSNREVIGEITYTDFNSLSITFSGGFSGKAYLN